jgi:putative hydrolase of the HAD superfamily
MCSMVISPVVKHPHPIGANDREIRAVLFDFGGVISSSPFEAFAGYEHTNGLPPGFLQSLNATNHHDNAWAKLERGEVDVAGFARLFEAEASALGHRVDALEVLSRVGGELRPRMVETVRLCSERYVTGLLTNNFLGDSAALSDRFREQSGEVAAVLAMFDAVIESSKVGVRKPEVRFFELACEVLEIEPPEAVFLDDLGVNLKPARALGMHTIKVVTEDQAIRDLEAVLGHPIG